MKIVEGRKEKNATIVLDGKSFIACSFENCTLVYHGGETAWVDTRIVACNVVLQGPASNTANALRGLGWKPPEGWGVAPPENVHPQSPDKLPN
jgi:hypothetical protein